ncbi:hypothetical protein I6F21_35915 [Bradyrhizobium sp. NBAIM03]|uniref:hypothetical protein n=1 Tax=Bradyrhizobium sp. NBAIM03 TaxID=2793816 RepID=UPI001CD655DA|nr:hypothetical protein [Bradyrhizobium sp. NBAIM03]MCA1537902.1 hypothetical protein [Bradyrhizobium sp. NBAIM03]
MIFADPTLTTRISAYFERVGDIGQVASSAPQLDSTFEPKLNCKTPALGDTPLSTLRDAISIAPTLLRGVTILHNDQRFMARGASFKRRSRSSGFLPKCRNLPAPRLWRAHLGGDDLPVIHWLHDRPVCKCEEQPERKFKKTELTCRLTSMRLSITSAAPDPFASFCVCSVLRKDHAQTIT